jgi:hypothetical protein
MNFERFHIDSGPQSLFTEFPRPSGLHAAQSQRRQADTQESGSVASESSERFRRTPSRHAT